MIILLLDLVEMHIGGYNIVLSHMYIIMKCGTSDFFLPSVSVEICETVGDEEEVGWQPISAISLQQSLKI